MTDCNATPPDDNSGRGFTHLPRVPSAYGGTTRVYESSAASAPHIWLATECPEDLNKPDGPTIEAVSHLTVENALVLADQIVHLVASHYQIEREDVQKFLDMGHMGDLDICPSCNGVGRVGWMHTDPRERARSMTVDMLEEAASPDPCPDCDGERVVPYGLYDNEAHPCPSCGGKGFQERPDHREPSGYEVDPCPDCDGYCYAHGPECPAKGMAGPCGRCPSCGGPGTAPTVTEPVPRCPVCGGGDSVEVSSGWEDQRQWRCHCGNEHWYDSATRLAVTDAEVQAAARVLNDRGWTCEGHEPEPFLRCSQCGPEQVKTAEDMLTAAARARQENRDD